jgi:RNA polymerase sigma-70 factor, ECF subfamily
MHWTLVEGNHVNDNDPVVATLNGDPSAFGHLVEKYQLPVYNLAYRMLGRAEDAEDISQEVFVRAYTKLRTFDVGKKFANWILAIASHRCIDHLRRKKPLYLDDQDYAEWVGSNEDAPEVHILREERGNEVRKLLAGLPPKYRNILILRYWHEMSYAEIGETTGLADGTVKTRLHRARRMLSERVSAPMGWAPRWLPKPTHVSSI